jgi:hypothetical protein
MELHCTDDVETDSAAAGGFLDTEPGAATCGLQISFEA